MTARQIEIPAGTRRVIEFGTTYSQSWSVEAKRGTEIAEGDVADAVFLLKRRLMDADADADVTKTLDDGIAVTTGKVTVTLDAADTADAQGKYYGTLRLYLADGGVVDWMDSNFDDTPYVVAQFVQGAVEAVA